MKDDVGKRLTRIANRYARRFNVKAAVYANFNSFDVLTKGKKGIFWVKCSASTAHKNPAIVARQIRSEIKAAWSK